MMKKRERKSYDDDDGRVIASMDFDAMGWRGRRQNRKPDSEKQEPERPEDELQLTAKEKRAMAGGVFAAAFLVAGVFALAGLLFILFCVFVWLK